ncbi:MAG TPA: TOMM precursor leader peptide-binding protein [Allosphingosinicella sp.]|jgi:ribosomal protein S12 methylthiotransferase accessory factor
MPRAGAGTAAARRAGPVRELPDRRPAMTAGLPRRPALNGACNIVPVDGGSALAVTASSTFALSGEGFGELFPFLLFLLDGRHSVAGIVERLETFCEADVLRALELLNRNGLLEEGDGDPAFDGPEGQARFFSGYGLGRASDAQSKLRTAQVGLLGTRSAAAKLDGELAECGVPPLRKPADGAMPDETQLAAFLEGLSLLIVVTSDWPVEFCERINRAALATGVAWLACSVEARGASVGPLFLPGETACFHCFSRRRRGAEDFIAAYDAMSRAWTGEFHDRLGLCPGLSGLVSGLAVVETVKFLTGFEVPTAVGAEWRFELRSGQLERHRVLKLPRCPECGPAHLHLPQASIWSGFMDEESRR